MQAMFLWLHGIDNGGVIRRYISRVHWDTDYQPHENSKDAELLRAKQWACAAVTREVRR
jgi:hypothetical protein